MEKKTLRTANWLKSVFLLAVMLIGAFSASANITQEMSLGELRSGSSYNVPANTHATGYFTAPSDGTVILTSNVDANTNLTPYYDSEYTEVVSTERDEYAKTKSFEAVSGTTYYFAATTSPTTSFDVVFTFQAKKPVPDYVYPLSVEPANGSTVAELSSFKLNFSSQDIAWGSKRYAMVYDASGTMVTYGTLRYDDADLYAIVAAFSPVVKADGEYKVVIPEEAYRVQGNLNPELTYNYTVDSSMGGGDEPGQSADVTFMPNPSEELESLGNVTVTFNDVPKGYFQPVNSEVDVLDENGAVVAEGTLMGQIGTMTIVISPEITTPGKYTIKFNKGDINYMSMTDYKTYSYEHAFEVTYTIVGSEEPEPEPTPTINMSFEPNPEEVQTSLAKVVVKFPDLGSDKFVIANVTAVNVYDANGNIVGEGQLNGGSQVEVFLVPEIKESGIYTIKFNDSDLMVYKGDNIPAFEVTYTVEAPELPVATWSIAEGAVVDSFSSVTITFDGVETAKAKGTYSNFIFYSVAEDGTATLVENYCSAGYMDTSASGNAVTFMLDPECYMNLYGGNYRIVIPVGSIVFNGDKENLNTEEYVLNFTLDAPGAPVEVDAAFTANPENNSTVSELKDVVLTFTDYESISVAELDLMAGSNIAKLFKVDDLTGSAMPAGYVFFEQGSAANALRLYFPMEYNGFDAVAIEGSYMIRIPAGVVTFTDGVSKEIVLNYTVKAAPSITATWSIAEGAVVDSFSSVTITFDGVETAKAKGTYSNFIFYSVAEDGTATLVENYCSAGYMDTSASGNAVTFTLDSECYMNLYGGNYRIVIPVGSIVFNGDKENLNTEEYVLNFTLDAPGAPVEVDAAYTVNPENNSTVSELKDVVLTFTDYESISVAELDLMAGSNIAQLFKVDDLTGSPMPAGYVFFEQGSAANALRLYFPMEYNGFDVVAIEGSYMIRIPAGVVTFTDGVSKEIILNYTVKANVEEPTGAPIAVSPEVGTTVETLSEIELTFDKNYYVSGEVLGNWTPFPAVYNESGEKVEGVALSWGYNEDALNSLKLRFEPALTESGTYTIKFPEGAVTDFYDSSISSPEFELTYIVEAPVVGGLPVAYEPEVGSEVPYLAKVTLYFSESDYPGGIDVTYFGTPEVYKDGQLIETSAYYAYDQYDYYKGYIEFTSPLTEAGTYTIKVKAGHFYEYLNESNAVPAFEMTYVVTGGGYVNNNPGPIAVIPASGSEVKEIDMISINFAEEDYPNGMDANSSTAVPVLNAAGEEVGKLKLQYDPDNYFAVKCTVLGGEPITAPGEYTIVIPEGHIWEYNGNKLETAVPEIVLTYTIKGEGVAEEVRLSSTVPAEGELDMSLYAGVFQGISLYFSEVVSMIADDQLPADMITIAKDGVVVEEKSLTKLVNDPFGDGNKVDLVFEKYSQAGEYVITIPGGWATYADGTVVGDIVLTYIIPENTDTNDFITDPEAGVVESLSKVWFQLTNRTYAAKNSYTAVPGYQWYGKPYVIDDATGEKVTDCYFYKEEDHCAFGIDLNTPIVTSGSYTLVIPQGQIAYVQKQKDLTEDEVNPEFRIQYTIEGEDPQYFPVTVNPEEGVVESLSVVTVTFAEGVTLELDENSSSYPRFYEVTENGDEFVRNGDFSVSGNVFTFSVYTDEETGELDAITEAGEYAFIIPVGLIKVDGVFTTEYRFEYQIGGATAALTITDPVPGTTVERLSQFTVVAPGATTLEQNETRRTIQLVKNDELVSNVTVLSTEGNTAVLQLSNVVTESGDYTLIIPPYFFLADGVEIEEQHTFNYTVLNDTPVFKKPTINPEEGLVEEFTEFVLTWEDVTEIVLDNSVMMGTSGIAMYDAMNEKVSDFIGMPSGDNAVMLNFMGAAPAEPGEYRLVIPAGMFTVDGATNHEMEFFYMYIPAIDFEITIDKSGTVESVEEFVLSFNPCEESVEINSECEESIGLWTSTYPEELIGYFEVTIEGLTAKLELTVDPITVEDGDYTILVPQDYFFVDGMPCGGETFNVTLVKSGIYGIEADAQGLNVYSVSGILVLRDAKATELKNLQKGIYIVNGKKVLVR